jgi:hypothetical protein
MGQIMNNEQHDKYMDNTMTVDNAMRSFHWELREYDNHDAYPGGVVIHLAPLGKTGFYVGTFTAYNHNGLKSQDALRFSDFLNITSELENTLKQYDTHGFTGKVVGWKPSQSIKNFLHEKKAHRLFFLHQSQVLEFVNEYMSVKRKEKRKREGLDKIIVKMG